VRVLIDECIDEKLRFSFPEHDCQTARYAGLAGLKNGKLLTAAEAAQFELLITVDQNIDRQQNFAHRKIAVLILCAPTNRLQDLLRLMPAVLEAMLSSRPSQIIRIK
jgi:hypothetical protein